jgi:hypothetical protein
MQNFPNRELQEEVRRFCGANNCKHSVALTVTMKQTLFKPHRRLTEIEAAQNFRHFMNRNNRYCFGHAFARYGKRIKVIPVQEVSRLEKRLHYHALMERPAAIDLDRFCTLLCYNWPKTEWGDHQMYVEPATEPEKWLAYITKQPDAVNAVDWENIVRF